MDVKDLLELVSAGKHGFTIVTHPSSVLFQQRLHPIGDPHGMTCPAD
jgi:hypothetical protein